MKPLWHLRTGPNSRVALRCSDQSVVSFGALTEIEILPPHDAKALLGLHLVGGILSFFHRDRPGRIRVITRGAVAGIEGTEFVMAVDMANNNERTTLSLIDGKVEFSNELGTLLLTNGEEAVAEPGMAPHRTAGFIANNVLQWAFYYPAVVDLRDLPLTPDEEQILADSLGAYRAGDLLAALAKYPARRQPPSDAERVYYAALLLSVGQVKQAEDALDFLLAANPDNRFQRLATALSTLIAAVKRQPALAPPRAPGFPLFASELLASSYYEQSRALGDASLRSALDLAQQAATHSPKFGFAWARVAELQFSFGHSGSALEALNKSLELAPRNAQALALKGFLLAAQNKTREAIDWFNQAIAVDSALGNAWLGRGLCKIRLAPSFFSLSPGERAEMREISQLEISGREDLLIAAALEPQRSLLRSYLGKAYGDTGDSKRALHELDLAKGLDLGDPTPWLYSALLNQRNNRINEAVHDLERSVELNENRRLYRSRFLLEQDRAVRSANLAAIYRDAGMFDWSVREASQAVNSDYANYSAHLFLANSYNQLRDPNLINLRYETATFSEYLLANLLAPVGATALSPYVSQQEYSRLFEQDRFGFSSETDYSSRGDWQQQASQFGWFKNSAYAADVFYRSLNGERPNNDLEQQVYSVQFKQQFTQQDSAYVQVVLNEIESGDVRQVYDPNTASRALRIKEEQAPNFFLGYHHEWSPGIHTLFLGGYLHDKFRLVDSNVVIRGVARDAAGVVTNTALALCQLARDQGSYAFDPITCDLFDSLQFRSRFTTYSAELQQIVQVSRNTLIVGGRLQDGDIETRAAETREQPFPPYATPPFGTDFVIPPQNTTTELTRLSFYGYDQWEVLDAFWLMAGLSYDHLRYPRNSDSPPVSADEDTTDRVSPKAGLIWKASSSTTVRGAYTKSLGGVFYDASVRLEPSQIAGFNQAYRSLIPESEAGNIPGSRFETAHVGLEQKLASATYLTLGAEVLKSKANRDVGVFDYPAATPSHLLQKVRFEEHSFSASLNQLLGREWAFGALYKVSEAQLETQFPEVSSALIAPTKNSALLHSVNLFAIYNHPSGFFANPQALWAAQSNHGYSPDLPGDEFWQFNVFAGYRFPRRQAQLTIGILNLADQDYRLNPLNLYSELPRSRTLTASFKFTF